MNSSSQNAAKSFSCSELKNSRFQKLRITVMPTSSSRSPRIETSRPQADHFSSERKYGLAKRQESRRNGRRPRIGHFLSSVGVDPGPHGGKPGAQAPPVHAKVGIAVDAARIQHEGACLPPGLADLRRDQVGEVEPG